MTPPTTTDDRHDAAESDLLARLRAGDDAAFAELVETHAGRLLALARRIVRSEADAEDVVQEAFLSAFKALSRFDGRSSLSTWLHRITVNAALMRQRRKAARPEAPIDTLLPQFEDGRHAAHPIPLAVVTDGEGERIERQEAFWHAMARLPQDFRDVIELRDIQGLDSKSAARELGISDALVRQRLHRARQALLTLLTPILGDSR
ncbi:MAG: sigma-70 family RNA polymerase sigma factor [Planctomycetes bacterium]|nr:sigma-70 family RNA polymerase sigma factor [Planctomycetota bacterium]